MNTSSIFTESPPKHPKVTGAPSQAFSFAEDFRKAVQKLIQTKSIAALGTIILGSTILQYLFDQIIHHDFSGAPTTIIGILPTKKENSASSKSR
jgi:hypothetical protein